MKTSQIEKLFRKHPVTGNTIFHELAYDGSLTVLKRIRDNLDEPCTFILQQFNCEGEFSIHVAAMMHRGRHAIRLIKLLRDLGADLDARDDQLENTVLHIAVVQRDHTLAKWLCKQSQIDINAEDVDGHTAYQLAQMDHDQYMMDILRIHGAQCNCDQQK
ncbi:vankyrin-b15.1 [Ichnoviriform fugitivi]|uniref:Vankyrin-b15.1 n=1 Tax=Ichnoviriform fugitivi TaxID=265522 RepID=A2Q0F2_9VIRU|nr:vankyrin-b15.1 [Ichnoviriform fugitivi]BAF45667.1 vankyrin-b15.1 [Ichnoviriform fugitivi]